jgi:hypothetical protein
MGGMTFANGLTLQSKPMPWLILSSGLQLSCRDTPYFLTTGF